ncbi:phosphoenolpyruvate carboxylase [bacterium]|nr:phosphoenolpyruvate carboxylase [bacterium]
MNLSHTVRLLGNILGQVLAEQESEEIFRIEEEIRDHSKRRRAGNPYAAKQLSNQVKSLTHEQSRAVASAFALYFDLVNLAEENDRVMKYKLGKGERGSKTDSIKLAIEEFKARRVPAEQVQALMDELNIELVLTAHPTQAKRRSLLSKLVRISGLLKELTGNNSSFNQRKEIKDKLYAEISTFWLTERARTAMPQVTDEVRTGLYFIDEVFWDIFPQIYQELEETLAKYYPGVTPPHKWLSLASWVGGDRDGNPNVTYPVTAETLRLHRGLAIEKHRKSIQDLARKFTFSNRLYPPPASLVGWFESRQPLPNHVAFLASRYQNETFRLALSLLASDLQFASQEAMTAQLLSDQPHQARVQLEALVTPIRIMSQNLPKKLSRNTIDTLDKQLHIFGLHAARLDIREDASRINAVVGEILRALDMTPDFVGNCAEDRIKLLTDLLDNPPSNLADRPGVTAETSETWSVFKLIQRAQSIYGKNLFGPFVISMAQCPADVLSVLLLSKWVGCQEMMIAPLFETVQDLHNAPQVLRDLFEHHAYRQHLKTVGDHQMVMIGYSDSNKDAGYLSANWNLYQAQHEIAKVCREYGIKLTLFHGRGGTVARGGGPANRAILAQPPGTINGRFRLTEQGETIASRYSNPDLAFEHLEQVVSAVITASLPEENDYQLPHTWQQELNVMSETAQQVYQELVYHSPGFMDFWQQVTPIREITQLRIGSRPAARQSGVRQVTKIRAIPWVFSWMQSRYNLPGWFGLGSGLKATSSVELLQEMYAQWPFFRAILDNAEMSLQKADMEIARLYLTLAEDQPAAEVFYDRIQSEYERTKECIMAISGNAHVLDSDPDLQHSIQLRNPYIDPLNFIQVETLYRLRNLPEDTGPEAEDLKDIIVLTINGIASGLRNTG